MLGSSRATAVVVVLTPRASGHVGFILVYPGYTYSSNRASDGVP